MADVEDVEIPLEEVAEDIEMEGGEDETGGGALAEIEPEVTSRVTFLECGAPSASCVLQWVLSVH